MIVTTLTLEIIIVGNGVICPPGAAGDPVGHQAVNAVVAPGQEQHHHPGHAHGQRGQVEQQELASTRRICNWRIDSIYQ